MVSLERKRKLTEKCRNTREKYVASGVAGRNVRKEKGKKDTYMEGLGRAVLGANLGFFNGGQVGAADRQQSPTAGKRNRKSSSKHDGYRSHTITQSYSLAQHLALKSEEISDYQAFHPKGR